MKIEQTALPGVLLTRPSKFSDDRGYFLETFRESELGHKFVQNNVSVNHPWVLRGLHYQLKNPQGKFVYVVRGSIFDVAVDIRRGSPTFGQSVGNFLNDATHHGMYIPPGFAHGFFTGSEGAIVHYSCTAEYDPASNREIRWDDPGLKIAWMGGPSPILSEKDAQAPLLRDAQVFDYEEMTNPGGTSGVGMQNLHERARRIVESQERPQADVLIRRS